MVDAAFEQQQEHDRLATEAAAKTRQAYLENRKKRMAAPLPEPSTTDKEFLDKRMKADLEEAKRAAYETVEGAVKELGAAGRKLTQSLDELHSADAEQTSALKDKVVAAMEDSKIEIEDAPKKALLTALDQYVNLFFASSWSSFIRSVHTCMRNETSSFSSRQKETFVNTATAMLACQRGGRIRGGLQVMLVWESAATPTDLDIHITCPESKAEVHFGKLVCDCVEEERQVRLDVDDLGLSPGQLSIENVFVQNPSSNIYHLDVVKYSGPSVKFDVIVNDGAEMTRFYLPPHGSGNERMSIFQAVRPPPTNRLTLSSKPRERKQKDPISDSLSSTSIR